MKIRKNICVFVLFCIEMFVIYEFRQPILSFLSFFNNESRNFFDDLFIGVIASVLFSLLQFFNFFLIDNLILYSRDTMILFFQRIYRCTCNNLRAANRLMMKYIFSAKVKWGVHINDDVRKIANTAEGIICCVSAYTSGYELTNNEKKELKNVLNGLVKELTDDGFQSYNEKKFTVHCTAMGLFALKKSIDVNLYEISDEEEEKVRKCLKKLLSNANDFGWGFENIAYDNKDYNRALSTVWAFRALNVWGFSGHRRYREVLMGFVGRTDGLKGFCESSTAQSSVVALLYLLANEVENKDTKKELFKKLNTDKMLSFMLSKINRESETEEYVISLDDTKKLSWAHLSECLIFQAVAQSMDKLSMLQTARFFYYLGKCLKKINNTYNFYVVETMNFKFDNPFFFPTAYLVMAVSNMIYFIESKDE